MNMIEYKAAEKITLTKKYLKIKIMENDVSFRDHTEERNHIYELMKSTVLHGESHSAIIIGPRGSGKTTLINSVLHQLAKETDLKEDAIIVKLNGLVHCNEKIAVKSITAQLRLENAVGDHVFGSFAEQFEFLLKCLESGSDRRCRSMVFVLEQLDVFCRSGSQHLLYSLFDITDTNKAPLCLIATSSFYEVLGTLEKRIISRFSQRQIRLYHADNSSTASIKKIMVQLLSLPLREVTDEEKENQNKCSVSATVDPHTDGDFSVPEEVLQRCYTDSSEFKELDPPYVNTWNSRIVELLNDDQLDTAVAYFCFITNNEQLLRNVLFQVVSKLRPSAPFIDSVELSNALDATSNRNHRVRLLHSLSILELSLVIAIKHAMDIFDNQPINFEMVLHRYKKFAESNASAQSVPRPVILKAFEHLQTLEIIKPLKNSNKNNETIASGVQKEFTLYMLAIIKDVITEAIKTYKDLPTEIGHWYNNSVI